jgi:agmatine/peptidylarginine deiminase
MPDNDRRQVFRTYTNAVALNGVVLVPVYRQHQTGRGAALRTFRQAFPGRAIVPIESDGIADLAGAVHCMTMQVPVK